MEGLKFHVEPDFIYVDSTEELINHHKVINENLFPIIFRVNFLRYFLYYTLIIHSMVYLRCL